MMTHKDVETIYANETLEAARLRKKPRALPRLRVWDQTADSAALDGINQLVRKRRKSQAAASKT